MFEDDGTLGFQAEYDSYLGDRDRNGGEKSSRAQGKEPMLQHEEVCVCVCVGVCVCVRERERERERATRLKAISPCCDCVQRRDMVLVR